MNPIAAGVLVAGLLVLSGFFSSSETALFSLQAIDRDKLKEGTGRRVLTLLRHPTRTLASLLMGNELANISLSAVCASALLTVWPERPWLNLVVATPLLVLFGEVLPKTFALRNSRRWALAIAGPLALWAWAVTGPRWLLVGVANFITARFGANPEAHDDRLEEKEVRELIDQGRRQGAIGAVEHRLIERVFQFGEVPVSRLMTPRPDIVSFPLSVPFETLMHELRQHRVSRVPIYVGKPDNVIGVLITRKLLRFAGGEAPGPRELKELLRPAWYVPETKIADDLMREIQLRQDHLALVVDEHGVISGLITLDDLLSELVGQELDDEDSDDISRIRADIWTVSGSTDVEDFIEETAIDIPPGEYQTIAGFIMTTLGRVPDKGDELRVPGAVFSVSQMEGRRVVEVSVRIVDDADQPPQEVAK